MRKTLTFVESEDMLHLLNNYLELFKDLVVHNDKLLNPEENRKEEEEKN